MIEQKIVSKMSETVRLVSATGAASHSPSTTSQRISLSLLALWGLAILGSPGCSFFSPKVTEPTNNLRSETSGMSSTGVDRRARQIESNLGVR